MAYEPRPGQGSLFRNDKRSKDTQPNATGYILAHRDIKAGEKVRLAAWTKKGTHGAFQSLVMSDERPKQEESTARQGDWRSGTEIDPQAPLDPLDDDSEIPF